MPNRASRRHPPVNGTHPLTAAAAIPELSGPIGGPRARPAPRPKVTARPGAEVDIAGRTYITAIYPIAGCAAVMDYLAASYPKAAVGHGATAGQQIVEGVSFTRAYDVLQGLLELALLPRDRDGKPLPPDLAEQGFGDEIAAALDTFFDQSGLRQMVELVKASAAPVVAAIERAVAAMGEEETARLETEMRTEMRAMLTAASAPNTNAAGTVPAGSTSPPIGGIT